MKKKVLLPLIGDHFPQDLLDFVCKLHPVSPLFLTAAMVPASDYAGLLEAELPRAVSRFPEEEDEEEKINRQRLKLDKVCEDLGIQYKVHLNRKDFALQCLRKESRYADLLLLNSCDFFDERDSVQPNAWMKDLLRHAECPVLLLPGKASLPGEIILAYDGSAESVFAIKEFAHLFPEFSSVQTTLVYISDAMGAKIPDESWIRELARLHFKKLRVLNLQMKSTEFYHTWIGMMNTPWLVTGSFGRSAMSQLFRGSFSDELIRLHQVPVFVAHK